ncbi:hypothetical protein NFI08_16515 [Halomonas sp. EF61]|uniref:hypothetical protein n=1 Tax=Halomonas sp. EF61 TaxID=2950869 RepID=UPI0032DE9C24
MTASNEVESLRERLEKVEAERDALWETFIKVADMLEIDAEKARTAPGKPSDVFANYLARHDAELLNRPFEGLPGCTDGGCVVKKPNGMHTNGGCQCIKHQTASTIVQRLAHLRDQRRR